VTSTSTTSRWSTSSRRSREVVSDTSHNRSIHLARSPHKRNPFARFAKTSDLLDFMSRGKALTPSKESCHVVHRSRKEQKPRSETAHSRRIGPGGRSHRMEARAVRDGGNAREYRQRFVGKTRPGCRAGQPCLATRDDSAAQGLRPRP